MTLLFNTVSSRATPQLNSNTSCRLLFVYLT